jgi:hypothetical protein
MLSYDKWKLLNESIGRPTVLGFGSQKQVLGIQGSRIKESGCGCAEGTCECGSKMEDEDDDMEDDEEDAEGVDIGDYDDEVDADAESTDDMDSDMDSDMEDDMEDDEDHMGHSKKHMDADMEDDEDHMEDDEDDMEDDEDDMEDDEDDMEDDEDDMGEEGPKPPAMESKLKSHMPPEDEWWKSVKSMIGNMTPSGDLIKEDLGMDPTGFSGPIANFIRRMNAALKEEDFTKIASRGRELDLLEQVVHPMITALMEKFNMSAGQVGTSLRKIASQVEKELTDKSDSEKSAGMPTSDMPGAW